MDEVTITKEQLAAAVERKRQAATMGTLEALPDANAEASWLFEQLTFIVRDAEAARKALEAGDVHRVGRS